MLSDCHLTSSNSIGRLDDVFEAGISKFSFVLEYASKNDCLILQAGDFLDSSRSWMLHSRLVGLFKKYPKVQIFIVRGQHDFYMYSEKSKDATSLGVFVQLGYLHELDEVPINITREIHLYGCSWGQKIPVPRYNKKEIYDEFSLDEECRIIGNIGRLSPQKGQNYLIKAASVVIEEFKSVRFFFVGEGELESELKTEVQEKGLENYFIFTGHRIDIPRLLNAFEMLVMPSLFEGLCFAVIEAQAMGIPVIATAVGGMRRSVIDGKTGLLIPPGDSQALAKAILWMLEHPKEAKEMGLAGQRHFAQLFTQERMVKKTEELYASILAKVHPN